MPLPRPRTSTQPALADHPLAPVPAEPTTGRRERVLPDLRALNAFVTVCQAGAMALAAQRLGMSQSAVSQMIKGLELDLGVVLFDREVRPSRPTRAGQQLLELAAELLAHARAVSEQVRQTERREHALIRLGCVDSFAATVGPSLVRALSGTTRKLQLWSGLTPGLSAQLQGRELDLAICTETPVADPHITPRLMFSEDWVLVLPLAGGGAHDGQGPRQSPEVPTAPATVSDLRRLVARLPLIRYTQRSVSGQQVERLLRHLGLQPERRFEFDATDPLLSLVAAGLGWAISTPLCLWQSRAWLGHVQVLPLPPSQLGQRDFFLLGRESAWDARGDGSLADEVIRVTRSVLRQRIVPELQHHMPHLPSRAITVPDDEDLTRHAPCAHPAEDRHD